MLSISVGAPAEPTSTVSGGAAIGDAVTGTAIGDAVTGTPSLAGLSTRPCSPPGPILIAAGNVLIDLTAAGNVLIEDRGAASVVIEPTGGATIIFKLTAAGNGLIDGLVTVEPVAAPPTLPLEISVGAAPEPTSTTAPRPAIRRLLTNCSWAPVLTGVGASSTHRDSHPWDVEIAIVPACCPSGMPVDISRRTSRTSQETWRPSVSRERPRRQACANFFIMKDIVLPSLVQWVCLFQSKRTAGRHGPVTHETGDRDATSGKEPSRKLHSPTKWVSLSPPTSGHGGKAFIKN
jgi:hypothetical protein